MQDENYLKSFIRSSVYILTDNTKKIVYTFGLYSYIYKKKNNNAILFKIYNKKHAHI